MIRYLINVKTSYGPRVRSISYIVTAEEVVENLNMAEQMKLYHIYRFNSENFHLCCKQMEIYMKENKLKPYVLEITARLAENTDIWDAKNAQAQAFLMRDLELDQLRY